MEKITKKTLESRLSGGGTREMKTLSSLFRRSRRRFFEKLFAGFLAMLGLAGFFLSLDAWVRILHLNQ